MYQVIRRPDLQLIQEALGHAKDQDEDCLRAHLDEEAAAAALNWRRGGVIAC